MPLAKPIIMAVALFVAIGHWNSWFDTYLYINSQDLKTMQSILDIQYGTSFGYPISAMGAHVFAVPNHQTGRITPLETRSRVAMAGTFGYELDIAGMSEKEKTEV